MGDISVLILDFFLLGLAIVTAVAVIEMRSLFAATILSGFYSLILALIYQNLGAVDVSFTEAAVGAGITTVLLLGALVAVGRREKERHRPPVHLLGLFTVVLTGGLLIYGTLDDMPAFGDPQAPVHSYRVPQMLSQTVGLADLRGSEVAAHGDVGHGPHSPGSAGDPAHDPAHADSYYSAPDDDWHGHVPNTVTSLLAGYRGYDTMFETAVIFTAGMALVLLLRRRPRPPGQASATVSKGSRRAAPSVRGHLAEQAVLRVVTKITVPYIILFGLYVITHGEIGPGGGFQGGVIIAAAFILYGLIYGRDALQQVLPHRLVDAMAAFGVLLYAGVGAACIVAGGNFLEYHALFPGWPALGLSLVEYGVGITVCFVMITIFNKMTAEDEGGPSLEPGAEAPPKATEPPA